MRHLLRALAVLAAVALTGTLALPAHADPAPASSAVKLGPAQKILGPAPYIDSLFTDYSTRDRVVTHRHHHKQVSFRTHWHAFMSMATVYGYDMNPKTGALSHEHVLLTPGSQGSADQCGVHPIGDVYHDPHHPGHLVTFYHAEQAYAADLPHCNHNDKRTRWTIRRMDSWNDGASWRK